MSDKAYAQEDPNVTPVKLSKRRKLANHCKRFWWAHLIALICIVVLVVCLVYDISPPPKILCLMSFLSTRWRG